MSYGGDVSGCIYEEQELVAKHTHSKLQRWRFLAQLWMASMAGGLTTEQLVWGSLQVLASLAMEGIAGDGAAVMVVSYG